MSRGPDTGYKTLVLECRLSQVPGSSIRGYNLEQPAATCTLQQSLIAHLSSGSGTNRRFVATAEPEAVPKAAKRALSCSVCAAYNTRQRERMAFEATLNLRINNQRESWLSGEITSEHLRNSPKIDGPLSVLLISFWVRYARLS